MYVRLKDKAGNTSELGFTSRKAGGARAGNHTMTITSLKYNDTRTSIPNTQINIAWNTDNSGSMRYLFQTYRITGQEGIVALYNAAKSKTTSIEKAKGSKVTKTTTQGLSIIKLKTQKGGVVVA